MSETRVLDTCQTRAFCGDRDGDRGWWQLWLWTVDDCLERKFHCVISRLSVIQEADTGPTINILEATPGSAKPVSPTSNNLSNYFGTPQTSGAGAGDSIFDQLTFPRSGPDQVVEAGGFTDISINTKRASNISPSHLPSQTDHCTDGPRASKRHHKRSLKWRSRSSDRSQTSGQSQRVMDICSKEP